MTLPDRDDHRDDVRRNEAHIRARSERLEVIKAEIERGDEFYSSWPARRAKLVSETSENEKRLEHLLDKRQRLEVQGIRVSKAEQVKRLKEQLAKLEKEVAKEAETGEPTPTPIKAGKHTGDPALDRMPQDDAI